MIHGRDVLIPVTLLTGFLGSGKTTVLNHLLQLPELADTAVIINEFGDVGLDHLLVEHVSETVRLLQSGCLCCTVRGDLVDTLLDLHERRIQQSLPAFTRVIIESTGLADPTMVLQTFMVDPQIVKHYRLEQVITTVDAFNGSRTMDRHDEALKQVSLADRLLLTKTDLVDEASLTALIGRLTDLNPGAEIIRVVDGQASAGDVLERVPESSAKIDAHILRIAQGHIEASHRDGKVQSHCLVFDQPLSESRVAHWLELMAEVRGDSLLRVKGLVQLTEYPGRPTVIHGVQQIFHPLRQLSQWPSSDHRSRIVLISQDLEFSEIVRTFEKFVGVAVPVFRPVALVKV